MSDANSTGNGGESQPESDRGTTLPEQYRDAPDARLTESIGTTVASGTKQFLEDYVDVHPNYDRVAELLRDHAEALKREKGEQVADLKHDLDARREEL